MKISILVLVTVLVFGSGTPDVFAQTSAPYIPLIGITSVPEPLALPEGGGTVTYHYAVKNFLREAALTGIRVVDDKCSPVAFVEGDDNGDSKLDYSETWRYACTVSLSTTTESVATAAGSANTMTATHKAYATVIVGSTNPAPLVSIINVTKVAYPLSLPALGGDIAFTYKVTNPGLVSLSDVTVTDDKCSAMSGKLGDTNVNNLLDTNEVWIYTCTAHLIQTTTNTVTVTAFANGLKARGEASIIVKVGAPVPGFPDLNLPSSPTTEATPELKIIVWGILLGILAVLSTFFFFTQKRQRGKRR